MECGLQTLFGCISHLFVWPPLPCCGPGQGSAGNFVILHSPFHSMPHTTNPTSTLLRDHQMASLHLVGYLFPPLLEYQGHNPQHVSCTYVPRGDCVSQPIFMATLFKHQLSFKSHAYPGAQPPLNSCIWHVIDSATMIVCTSTLINCCSVPSPCNSVG